MPEFILKTFNSQVHQPPQTQNTIMPSLEINTISEASAGNSVINLYILYDLKFDRESLQQITQYSHLSVRL